jgi:hypothetical protein
MKPKDFWLRGGAHPQVGRVYGQVGGIGGPRVMRYMRYPQC